MLRNELRERACKEASSAVQWSGVEEVVEVVVGGGGEGSLSSLCTVCKDASRRRRAMTCINRHAERVLFFCFFKNLPPPLQ